MSYLSVAHTCMHDKIMAVYVERKALIPASKKQYT